MGDTKRSLLEATFVMVDDDLDQIFSTRRRVRQEGIVNRFVSESRPDRLFETLGDLIEMGIDRSSFLLLLDVNMPRESGFQTLRKIRAHPDFRDMPVLMFSASENESDILEAIDLGCDGYVVKPFTSEEFFCAISSIPQVKKRLLIQ